MPSPLLEYALVRARILWRQHPENAHELHALLAHEHAPINTQHYLDALTLSYTHNTAKALSLLDTLHARHPLLFLIPTTAAEIALKAGLTDEALARTQRILYLAPEYFPAQLVEARALLTTQPQQAYDRLKLLTRLRAEDPVVWQLYANAAQTSGHTLDSVFALISYRQLMGDVSSAMALLDTTETQHENDVQFKERIAALRTALQSYEKDDAKTFE